MVSPILSCKCGPKRIGRSRIAQARPGWVNGAHQPFQIAFREDRARRPYRSPAALQGLAGIVIPSRKTQARHSGQLCSIRGKSGGARSGAKPYRRVPANGRPIDVSSGVASCSGLCAFVFFSLVRLRLLIAAVSNSRNDFAKYQVKCFASPPLKKPGSGPPL